MSEDEVRLRLDRIDAALFKLAVILGRLDLMEEAGYEFTFDLVDTEEEADDAEV